MSNIMAGVVNLDIQRGETFSKTLSIEIDDVILPLDGCTVESQIRVEPLRGEAALVVAFTVAVNTSTDEFTLSLTSTQTAAITQNRAYYDVLVRDAGNDDTYYVKGRINFHGTCTVKA